MHTQRTQRQRERGRECQYRLIEWRKKYLLTVDSNIHKLWICIWGSIVIFFSEGCCSKLQPKMIRHGQIHWQFALGNFCFYEAHIFGTCFFRASSSSSSSCRLFCCFFLPFFRTSHFYSFTLTSSGRAGGLTVGRSLEPSVWLSIMHAPGRLNDTHTHKTNELF